MSRVRKLKQQKSRRIQRVRSKVRNAAHPRVSVFRSAKQLYGQIIDDTSQKTLASCSSLQLKDLSGDKKEVAKAVGLELAQRAREKGIESIIFDRGPYLYHGRVKAFAEGLREGGLKL